MIQNYGHCWKAGESCEMGPSALSFACHAPFATPKRMRASCRKRPQCVPPRCAVPLENTARFKDQHIRVDKFGKPPAEDSPHFKEYWQRIREMEVAFRGPDDPELSLLDDPQQAPDNFLGPPDGPYVPDNPGNLLDTTWTRISEEELDRLNSDDPFYMAEGEDYEGEINCFGDILRKHRRPLNLTQNAWRLIHLGTSSALPTRKRNVSSTAFLASKCGTRVGDERQGNGNPVQTAEPHMYLVDCGENTTGRLEQCYWCRTHGFRWMRAIFITHMHGDHVYGLPPMLKTLGEYFPRNKPKPVIRIFGPPGIRGFIRSSLFMEKEIGIKFSVSELLPRERDFEHIQGVGWFPANSDFLGGEKARDYDARLDGVPRPHPDEARADDIEAADDGYWHVYRDEACGVEVIAGPLKHRLPCFGYVFKELPQSSPAHLSGVKNNGVHDGLPFPIDLEKARALGIRGRQYAVLRSGRSVTVRDTNTIVSPGDVAPSDLPNLQKSGTQLQTNANERKVVVLGDTCDSSTIAKAAYGCDLLVHEATFLEELSDKAESAMHSTGKMAGAFATSIRARKLVLTHFSSRYEAHHLLRNDKSKRARSCITTEEVDDANVDDDLVSPTAVISEAKETYKKGLIVAAYDFMEHDLPARYQADTESPPQTVTTNPPGTLKTTATGAPN